MPQDDLKELTAAVREVLKRSVVDPDFRQLAANDANAALSKVNPRLKPSVSIQFIDNFGKEHKTITLPDPVSGTEELSEEELEQIAGGCGASSCGVSSKAE